jgi:hypothetical protein
MRYIAHRGLFNGPDKTLENRPEQIKTALDLDYDCEIDLWIINSDFYLGHDKPDYLIDAEFLKTPGLWIHAKNLAALRWLTTTGLKYFWHEEDKFTLTSNNFIWTYPGNELTARSIMVMPEYADKTLANTRTAQCYAICSDWVEILKQGKTHEDL